MKDPTDMTPTQIDRELSAIASHRLERDLTLEEEATFFTLQSIRRKRLVRLEPIHRLLRRQRARRGLPLTGTGSTKRMQNIFRRRRK